MTKTIKTVKHKGEKEVEDRIQAQLRLYPRISEDDENKKKPSTKTLKVKQDDSKPGTKDNFLEVEVEELAKLDHEAGAFIHNYIMMKDAVFEPKEWDNPTHYKDRFDLVAKSLSKRAKGSLLQAQASARKEILDNTNWDEMDVDRDHASTKEAAKNQASFLSLINTAEWLLAQGYLHPRDVREWRDDEDPADDEDQDYDVDTATLEHAKEEGLKQYERYVWFYLGTVLFIRPHRAYQDHKTYFMNHIVKPYKELVVDFNTRMREYAECFKDLYLPPPYSKTRKLASKAVWREKKELTEREIRQAIYNALPTSYQDDLETRYKDDFQDMEETEFLAALTAYEIIDDRNRKKLEAERLRDKAEKKAKNEARTKKGGGKKRESDTTEEQRKGSRPKYHCDWCKDNGYDKYWTHNEDLCGHKKRVNAKKESNAQEKTMKEMLSIMTKHGEAITELMKQKKDDEDLD